MDTLTTSLTHLWVLQAITRSNRNTQHTFENGGLRNDERKAIIFHVYNEGSHYQYRLAELHTSSASLCCFDSKCKARLSINLGKIKTVGKVVAHSKRLRTRFHFEASVTFEEVTDIRNYGNLYHTCDVKRACKGMCTTKHTCDEFAMSQELCRSYRSMARRIKERGVKRNSEVLRITNSVLSMTSDDVPAVYLAAHNVFIKPTCQITTNKLSKNNTDCLFIFILMCLIVFKIDVYTILYTVAVQT